MARKYKIEAVTSTPEQKKASAERCLRLGLERRDLHENKRAADLRRQGESLAITRALGPSHWGTA